MLARERSLPHFCFRSYSKDFMWDHPNWWIPAQIEGCKRWKGDRRQLLLPRGRGDFQNNSIAKCQQHQWEMLSSSRRPLLSRLAGWQLRRRKKEASIIWCHVHTWSNWPWCVFAEECERTRKIFYKTARDQVLPGFRWINTQRLALSSVWWESVLLQSTALYTEIWKWSQFY